jgi:hypothetical protein
MLSKMVQIAMVSGLLASAMVAEDSRGGIFPTSRHTSPEQASSDPAGERDRLRSAIGSMPEGIRLSLNATSATRRQRRAPEIRQPQAEKEVQSSYREQAVDLEQLRRAMKDYVKRQKRTGKLVWNPQTSLYMPKSTSKRR